MSDNVDTNGNKSRTWTIGKDKITRTLVFEKESGIRTTSFTNGISGHDYAAKGQKSEEFLIVIDQEKVSGLDSRLVLRDVKLKNFDFSTKATFELEKDGLAIELSYTYYNNMPIIRKSICLRNITADRKFEIGGVFASERVVLTMPPCMKAVWINGITDPLSPNVFSYLDYGLEERTIEPGNDRVFTNQIPRDMSYLQQWKRGKIPSINHSNYSYFPWITLWDSDNREGMFFGLEWSGPWRMELSPSNKDNSCLLTVSMGENFYHTLAPGESIVGLDLFEGMFSGGPEDAGIETQNFFDSYLAMSSSAKQLGKLNMEPYSLPPVCWNSWLAFKTNINEEMIKKQANVAAQLGFEAFVLDYGWSISAGDRQENRVCFPSGIKKTSEYVKSLGMKFGLWVAIIALDPETAPTEDPFEWFVLSDDGSLHDEEMIAGKCACLASGYKNYVENELERIITEYQVDWLKFDQNMFIECYAKGHEHQNNRDSLYYQVRSLYEVLDNLLERHPDLIIECALSGAIILDYGILQRAHTALLHDDNRTYFVRRFFHGISYPLPPRYTPANSYALPSLNRDASAGDLNDRKDMEGRRNFFDYFYRSSIMGACNISDDLIKLPPEAYESMKRVIELYKNVRCRIKGPIRHILPQPRDPREWDAAEVYDNKICEGMVFIFRPSSSVPEINIKLTGLDNDKKYQIYSENNSKIITTLIGRELMELGIRIRINETSGSEILHFWV